MSEENVALAYEVQDAFNRRDLDAYLALCDPDLEFTPRILEIEGGGPYRGHEGIRTFWEDLLGVFPDFMVEIDEVRDLGDLTVSRVRLHGEGTDSHVPTEGVSWMVARWRRGKCVWSRNFTRETDALEAAGMSK